jgi:hypothetical protein
VSFLVRRGLFEDGWFLHEFEYYDAGRGVALGGRSRIITVELGKLGAAAGKPVEEMSEAEEWGIFLQYLTDKRLRGKINEIAEREEEIAMAGRVLLGLSRDENERFRLMSEHKYALDEQSKLVDARRAGIAQGIAQGMAQGRTQGIAQGIAQGITQGIAQGRTEAVQEMLDLLKSGVSGEELLSRYKG